MIDEFALVSNGFLLDEDTEADYDFSLVSFGYIVDPVRKKYYPFRFARIDIGAGKDCLKISPTASRKTFGNITHTVMDTEKRNVEKKETICTMPGIVYSINEKSIIQIQKTRCINVRNKPNFEIPKMKCIRIKKVREIVRMQYFSVLLRHRWEY